MRTKEGETSSWKRSTMSEQVILNRLLLSKRCNPVPAAGEGHGLGVLAAATQASGPECCCLGGGESMPVVASRQDGRCPTGPVPANT